ncbi:nitrile hydratase subunit alpha, partial [Pseudomonadota bacterium]|nr:nitrile hydratase subunit alpha [Pseudomonadota bacterium]
DHDDHHSLLPTDPELRVKAIETLLLSKGLIDSETLDELIDTYENKIGPQNGAKVVAKAWVDSDYKKRLLENATSAIRELSYQGRQGENMVVVENTPEIHNVIVCTLCSCYPWPVLGIPPTWYKSDEYRSRTVREPRKVLSEFGVKVDDEIQVKVWDSTAELRYLVLPMRPEGTENMNEDELAKLVTRNSMIGTGLAENIK